VGVATAPGSSLYSNRSPGSQQARFTFCKKEATLDQAARRLMKLKKRP